MAGTIPARRRAELEEADLVLDVALRLEALLKDAGVEVIMTRRTETFIALEERTAIANRADADLFLSIHSNASAQRRWHTAWRPTSSTSRRIRRPRPSPRAKTPAVPDDADLPDIVRAIALNNKIDESRDFASMVQNALYTKLQKTNAPSATSA